MKITKFEIKQRVLNKLNQVTYTGKSNIDTFDFEFDEEWIGLEKTLVIITDIATYNVPILNNKVTIPTEFYIDSQIVTIGVFGKKDNTILSSTLKNIWLTKGAYTLGQEPANLPTPTQWDLYIEQINKLLNKSKTNAENCEKILSEVRIIQNELENAKLNLDVYNQNSIEKIQELNDMVQNKKSEINSHVENKKQELENFAKTITVITSGTDDLIDGKSELPAGSMYLVYETDEDEVNQDA